MSKNRKRIVWIGGIIGLVLVVGGIFISQRNNATADAPQTGDIVTTFIGDLAASATASGEVVAQREARLTVGSSGTVAEVLVAEGDVVAEGITLLQLDTADLERAVANAEQALIIQETNLSTQLADASAVDIAAAEAAVASAQAQLDDLLDGPNENDIAAAEASLRAAQADVGAAAARLNAQAANASEEALRAAEIQLNLAQQTATSAAEEHSTILVTEPEHFLTEDLIADIELSRRSAALQANADLAAAQEAYNELLNGDPNSIAVAQAGVTLAAASRDSAQIQLDIILQDPTAAQIAAAEASLAQAQSSLENLLDGASAAQIAITEAQVEQSRIALQQAQNSLADATLTAPFDGVITAVHVSPGELASGIVIEMVDTDSLEVVLDVDEVDIGDISAAQAAEINLEAWPNDTIEAEVASIAPINNQTAGSSQISYQVFLSLGETELPILVGMTANANLVTAQREDVLLVSNQAITPERVTGKYFVNLLGSDDSVEKIEVTIGLRDNDFTQITGGLREGDRLRIGGEDEQFFGPGRGSNNDDGGPFGGN
ncbi:MAG: efflux RND transporter periplasmic adaptor subunit [Chloroflexi bacterium]|nr:efflux RND transporter periplasmic adaptor subunit [Chloroflexota bacterium]